MSDNVRNCARYEADGEVEYKGVYYTYHAEWLEADYLTGGAEPGLQGWEREVVDYTFRWRVEGGTGDMEARDVGMLEQAVWDDAMENKVEDEEDWEEDDEEEVDE